jgi:ubiquinol-cytochrome c reductase cytochrome b subunit
METPFILIAPVIGIGILLAVPFVAGEGEKHWSRRPVAVLTVLTVAISVAILNHLGTYEPWSPHMTAWSGNPLPLDRIHGATPTELQGAVVFQGKQCRNCHEVGGLGGQRGPALDDVANRLTYDQLIRQVLQGGGNMPAYGKNLSPMEVSALISFLETMHRPGERQAQDAALPEQAVEQEQPAYTSTTLPAQYQSQLTEPKAVKPAKPNQPAKVAAVKSHPQATARLASLPLPAPAR